MVKHYDLNKSDKILIYKYIDNKNTKIYIQNIDEFRKHFLDEIVVNFNVEICTKKNYIHAYIKVDTKRKYRQKINDEVEAIIYYYPYGYRQKKSDYVSCHISVRGAKLNDDRKFIVRWKSKHLFKTITFALKKYQQFNDKSMGFDDLFPRDYVMNQKYIKISFLIM